MSIPYETLDCLVAIQKPHFVDLKWIGIGYAELRQFNAAIRHYTSLEAQSDIVTKDNLFGTICSNKFHIRISIFSNI